MTKSCINKNYCIKYIKENFGKISEREMARRLKLGKTTVNRWHKEIGLKTKKHSVDTSFFKNENPDMYYVLGYIFSDGNIGWNPKKSYRSLTITAAEKDKDHLDKIRKILNSSKELLYSPKTKSYRLIVCSKNICLDLMKLGITPKKSLIVKFPGVPKKFINHFIRGIVDGDGNIRYVNRKRSPYFEITISSGSEKFCRGLRKNILLNIGIDVKIRKITDNLFILQYSCQRGLRLAEWIYKNASLFLDRKFQQYKLALEKNNN